MASVKCPECERELIERPGGLWCPSCKGWLASWTWENHASKPVLWTATKP